MLPTRQNHQHCQKGSDPCTLCAQQWYNTKAHWSGTQCAGPTPICLGVVSLLCIVSVLIISPAKNMRKQQVDNHVFCIIVVHCECFDHFLCQKHEKTTCGQSCIHWIRHIYINLKTMPTSQDIILQIKSTRQGKTLNLGIQFAFRKHKFPTHFLPKMNKTANTYNNMDILKIQWINQNHICQHKETKRGEKKLKTRRQQNSNQ